MILLLVYSLIKLNVGLIFIFKTTDLIHYPEIKII